MQSFKTIVGVPPQPGAWSMRDVFRQGAFVKGLGCLFQRNSGLLDELSGG
jgi:hypothetical protein